ncbi:hypothetical protein [Aeoliella sp.]|uniref:hypothetical protein n=1 Tax=Aeoliella sp. TaxID=2795800 RepID=UPI003CCB9DE0
MATFKDLNGNEWNLAVTPISAMKVREQCDPAFLSGDFGQRSDNTFDRLRADAVLLCRVLYVLTEAQRKERGISEQDFYLGVLGGVIDEATAALCEAIVAFVPKRQKELVRAVQKQHALEDEALAKATEKLNDPDLVAELKQRIDDQVDAAMKNVAATQQPTAAE